MVCWKWQKQRGNYSTGSAIFTLDFYNCTVLWTYIIIRTYITCFFLHKILFLLTVCYWLVYSLLLSRNKITIVNRSFWKRPRLFKVSLWGEGTWKDDIKLDKWTGTKYEKFPGKRWESLYRCCHRKSFVLEKIQTVQSIIMRRRDLKRWYHAGQVDRAIVWHYWHYWEWKQLPDILQ